MTWSSFASARASLAYFCLQFLGNHVSRFANASIIEKNLRSTCLAFFSTIALARRLAFDIGFTGFAPNAPPPQLPQPGTNLSSNFGKSFSNYMQIISSIRSSNRSD